MLCKQNVRFDIVRVLERERMSDKSENRSGDTVRLLRPPPRVFTDQCGRNVWMGDIEVIDLEAVQVVNTDPYNSAKASDPWSKT